MKINTSDFQIKHGERVDLKKWPTHVKPFFKSADEYAKIHADHIEELRELQELLYASNGHSLLLIFQAMDAAGKDSAIKHVMSGVNPQGCQVHSFKHPGGEDLQHDFLWRSTRYLPEKGAIGIFNRSYYEEVLIVRVHPEILKAENIPDLKNKKEIWTVRFQSINGLEKHLHHNGTRVLKFFLHLSKEEQRQRFLKRIEEPEKNWKFNLADMEERKYWKDYMQAYEACLNETSSHHAPWHVVPADDKENTHLIISKIIIDALKDMKMAYPKLSPSQRKKLQGVRKELLD